MEVGEYPINHRLEVGKATGEFEFEVSWDGAAARLQGRPRGCVGVFRGSEVLASWPPTGEGLPSRAAVVQYFKARPMFGVEAK